MYIIHNITQIHSKIQTSQVAASQITQNPYRRRTNEWHQALRKKKKAVLELLEAQRVIEDVEAEAAEYVPKALIARLHSKSYPIKDSSSVDGHFITTVSNVFLTSAQG